MGNLFLGWRRKVGCGLSLTAAAEWFKSQACPECGRQFTKNETACFRVRNRFRCPNCAAMLGWKFQRIHLAAVLTFGLSVAWMTFMTWGNPLSLLSREFLRIFALTMMLPLMLVGWLAKLHEEVKKVSDE